MMTGTTSPLRSAVLALKSVQNLGMTTPADASFGLITYPFQEPFSPNPQGVLISPHTFL